MKKKNSMIVLAIFVAVLVLGVGYAAVTAGNLNIVGDAKTKDTNLNVVFTGDVTTSTAEASTGAAVSASAVEDSLDADIHVTGLQKVGDTVTATYTIKNKESDLSASIVEDEITNSKTEFFTVTTDMSTAKTVAKGATTTVTVTVRLIKVPISQADSTANISIKLEASPVQP